MSYSCLGAACPSALLATPRYPKSLETGDFSEMKSIRGPQIFCTGKRKGGKLLVRCVISWSWFVFCFLRVELGESIVGGAYLCGVEMWAPFMVADGEGGQGSRVNTQYLK